MGHGKKNDRSDVNGQGMSFLDQGMNWSTGYPSYIK